VEKSRKWPDKESGYGCPPDLHCKLLILKVVKVLHFHEKGKKAKKAKKAKKGPGSN
jgi:hypothetical protein